MASDSDPEYYSDFETSVDGSARSPIRPTGPCSRSSRATSSRLNLTTATHDVVDEQFFDGVPIHLPLYESDEFPQEVDMEEEEEEEEADTGTPRVMQPQVSTDENDHDYDQEEFYDPSSPNHDHRMQDDLQQPTIATDLDGANLAEFSSLTLVPDDSVHAQPSNGKRSWKPRSKKTRNSSAPSAQSSTNGKILSAGINGGGSAAVRAGSASKGQPNTANNNHHPKGSHAAQPPLVRRPLVSSADSLRGRPTPSSHLPSKPANHSFSSDYNHHHVLEKVGVKGSLMERSEWSVAVSHQRPVASSVAPAMQHTPAELHRQLAVLHKRYDRLRKENDTLREKMDQSHFQETVSKMTMELSQRDERILCLETEVASLRQIIRYQQKQLTGKEQERQHDSDFPQSSEKYIEVLLGQVNKLRDKNLAQHKVMEDYDELNRSLQSQLDKWKRRAAALRRFKERVVMEKLHVSTDPSVPHGVLPSIGNAPAVPVAAGGEGGEQTREDRREEAAEKSYLSQISLLQREVAHLKLSLTEANAGQKKLQAELDRRETAVRVQVFQLREMKRKYEDLLEGNRQLVQAASLIMRDQAHAKKKPVVDVLPPAPVEEAPPAVSIPLAAVAKAAVMADDEEAGADLTFLTCHDVAQ